MDVNRRWLGGKVLVNGRVHACPLTMCSRLRSEATILLPYFDISLALGAVSQSELPDVSSFTVMHMSVHVLSPREGATTFLPSQKLTHPRPRNLESPPRFGFGTRTNNFLRVFATALAPPPPYCGISPATYILHCSISLTSK